MIILGLLSIWALLIGYLIRCMWVIAITMPVGQWVPFDDMLKLGYHWIATTLVLSILRDAGTVSTRYIGPEDARWLMDYAVGSDDVEPEPGEPHYHMGYPEYYDYMLHRRPRRRHPFRDLMNRRSQSGSLAPLPT